MKIWKNKKKYETIRKIEVAKEILKSDGDNDTYKYIVETYDECIDNKTFEDFIKEDCIIITEKELRNLDEFGDIGIMSKNLENLCEIMACFDFGDFYVGKNCIFSTEANKEKIKNRKVDFIGICMEYERLATLVDRRIAYHENIEDIFTCLSASGLDIKCDNIYGINNAETSANILERLNQILGLN